MRIRRIRAHDEFTDVKPGHNRLARTGIVGQQEAQRLAWPALTHQTAGDLHGVALHIRGMRPPSSGRTKMLGRYVFAFTSELERSSVAVERKRSLDCSHADRRLIGATRSRSFNPSIRCAVDQLLRHRRERHGRHHTNDLRRLNTRKAETGVISFSLIMW